MSAIQDLAPQIEQYSKAIRRAKRVKGITIAELVEQTGCSSSAVARCIDGTQQNPRLFDAAAMCKVLDLSLDDLFALRKPSGCEDELQKQIHALELDNAKLDGDNHRLDEQNAMLREQLAIRRPLVYVLSCSACALAFVLVMYLLFDANMEDAGFILNGKLSIFAWVVVAAILASATAGAVAIIKTIRKLRRKRAAR